MTDCLIIGFNDGDFDAFCSSIRGLGERSTAWRDIRTSVVSHNGKYLRALDLLSMFRSIGLQTSPEIFHNMDFLSPAILYLGSYLHKRSIRCDYINLFQQEKEQLKSKLQAGDVRAVVVTTTLYVTPEPIQEIVTFIRQCNRKVKIIIGGPYVLKETIDSSANDVQRLFRYLGGDFYVMSSEGEQTLYQILSALKAGGTFEDIANCAYRSGDGYQVNLLVQEENLLEDTVIDYASFPRRDLGELVSVRTALSCPFSCAYCGFPQRAGRHRAADLSHVEQELDALERLGHVSTLTFLDDSFNVPRSRFKQLLKMMIAKRYSFTWNSFIRCDHVDEEIIGLMKEAGCEGVFIGAESGNDAMLQRMNKTLRRHHLLNTVPLFKQAGIVSHMSLIIGFPGETDESVRDTISLIEESQPDFFRAQLWYCDPMTPIWQQRGQYGIRGAGFSWSHDAMTSQEAMDWVEEIFLSVTGSTWLPQHGFELWSIFYLQRKGMGLEQVKRFLACFNTAVKEQVVHSTDTDLDEKTTENIKAVCSNDGKTIPFPESVQERSGEQYHLAKEFWRKVFQELPPVSPAEIQSSGVAKATVRILPMMKAKDIRDTAQRLNVDNRILALSLFTAILSRVYGEFTVAVNTQLSDIQSFPLTFPVRWEEFFRDHMEATSGVISHAVSSVGHLPYFLESPFHAWADEAALSRIDAGFSVVATEKDIETYSQSQHGVSLHLCLPDNDSDDYLKLMVKETWASTAADDVASFYLRALTEISDDPNRLIGSLLAPATESHAAYADEDIDFQF